MYTNSPFAISGDLPDFMSHLEQGYAAIGGDAEKSAAFIAWAKEYLTKNRPTEVFPVDHNYGFLLTNGQRFKLCPGGASRYTAGSMASADNSISISR